MGMSFALGAIRKNTKSVWLCVLLHCVHNALYGVYTIYEEYRGSIAAAVILIIISVVWVMINNKVQSKPEKIENDNNAEAIE